MCDPVVFAPRSGCAGTCGIAESEVRVAEFQVKAQARTSCLPTHASAPSLSSAAESSSLENGYIPYRRPIRILCFQKLYDQSGLRKWPPTHTLGSIVTPPTTFPFLAFPPDTLPPLPLVTHPSLPRTLFGRCDYVIMLLPHRHPSHLPTLPVHSPVPPASPPALLTCGHFLRARSILSCRPTPECDAQQYPPSQGNTRRDRSRCVLRPQAYVRHDRNCGTPRYEWRRSSPWEYLFPVDAYISRQLAALFTASSTLRMPASVTRLKRTRLVRRLAAWGHREHRLRYCTIYLKPAPAHPATVIANPGVGVHTSIESASFRSSVFTDVLQFLG
ncbi:hypothetical protein B0H13DRAFT_2327741 [Mycena leptocephala]|nr:hypothetical protein B0H13DRAFT_2327741 [Mycena leptocephala]